jgi:hypothetical protein
MQSTIVTHKDSELKFHSKTLPTTNINMKNLSTIKKNGHATLAGVRKQHGICRNMVCGITEPVYIIVKTPKRMSWHAEEVHAPP